MWSSRSVPVPGGESGAARGAGRRQAGGGAHGAAALGAGGPEEPEDLRRRPERGLLVRPQQRGGAHRRALRGLPDHAHVRHGGGA